jgi:NAD(P)-dependent dehydrogenase (short-subunit alcohol dehydrogenase family)
MTDPGTLGGRVVVVTGAAGGIGSAITRRVAAAGGDVIPVDVAGEGVLTCDVRSEEQVCAAFEAAGDAITDVVHAAGICATAPVADMPLDMWQRILDVNLTGSFLVGREAARRLPDGGGLVFVASVAGLTGDPLFGAYCASKFGVVALMQVLARELGVRRIRANAVCPGGVRTAMSDRTIEDDAARLGRTPEELRSLYEADSFLHRWADPDEVADACVYLLSPSASYISGHSLVLNGGGNLSSHR